MTQKNYIPDLKVMKELGLISTSFRCQRCGEHVDGFFNSCGTIGYYENVEPWKKYFRKFEDLICDKCMHTDEQFMKDFTYPGMHVKFNKIIIVSV